MEATIVVTVHNFDQLNLMLRAVTTHAAMRSLAIVAQTVSVPVSDPPKQALARGLTVVEWQMVEFAAHGATRGRIAELLCLSTSTISTYWACIYTSLQVHTRSDVLDWYHTQVAKP